MRILVDNILIESDEYQYILRIGNVKNPKLRVREKKSNGEVIGELTDYKDFSQPTYHQTIEQVLQSAKRKIIRKSDAKTLEELAKVLTTINETIKKIADAIDKI